MDGDTEPPSAPLAANQATLRARNLAVILREILAAPQPLSRAGVAAATGTTRTTSSRLVDELVAAGLVDEISPVQAGPGRPGTPLVPARGTVGAIGAQINAARIGARLIDLSGAVLAESVSEHTSAECSPAYALEELRRHVHNVLDSAPPRLDVVGASLALPGVVDAVRQRVSHAPHLGWRDLDVAALAHQVLDGVPWLVRSQAHSAARATLEPRPGRLCAIRDFIYVFGDVALGAALVTDGVVRCHQNGFAGAFGHLPYRPDGPSCQCGAVGCLELYASSAAIWSRAGRSGRPDLDRLSALAEQGEVKAVLAIEQAGRALGTVLAGVLTVTDTSTLVLGGELGRLTPLLRPSLEAALQSRGIAGTVAGLQVVQAADPHAPLTGAAVATLRTLVDDPARYVDARRAQGDTPGVVDRPQRRENAAAGPSGRRP